MVTSATTSWTAARARFVMGDTGNDVSMGGAGDDYMWGHAGNDEFDGGDG